MALMRGRMMGRVAGALLIGGLATATVARAHDPTLRFRSEPKLRPPVVNVTHDPDPAGDIFLTPAGGPQSGPMILDSQGQLVWFHHVSGMAFNLEVQRYRGHPVLTWWQRGPHGNAGSEDVIMNRFYRIVRIIRAGNGYVPGLHEFQLTRQGTALLATRQRRYADLTSVSGPSNGPVWDSVIREVDIKSGRVLWTWDALSHVPISDSYASYNGPSYSYFHLNSIQQLPDGNLVISARNTWAIYEISRRTGRVMWELGGKHSSFGMGPGTGFEWQHDARLHRGGHLSLFDDAALPQEERESSAKVLRLDFRTMTASLIHRYVHTPPLLAGALGNTQILPDHNVFVGWGTAGAFSEYSPGGRQIFSGRFALGVNSYRAYRFPWTGRPQTPPSLAIARDSEGDLTAYASWNGATQVTLWRVLGGSAPHHLSPVGSARRAGFETAVRLQGRPRYVQVQAVDSTGHVLASSGVRPAAGA